MSKLFTIFMLFISTEAFCQGGVSINNTGAPPDPSAGLDVNFNNKGFVPPRVTTAQRDSIAISCSCTPVAGLIIFNKDCNNLNLYNGSAWVDMLGNVLVTAPTAGINVPSQTQIAWNWNVVGGATGYKWNTINNYGTATDNGTNISYTQTGLSCGTAYTLYVWAYSACGHSAVDSLTQTSSSCFTCGSPFTDSRDNQSYNTVMIGSQCWMAQNLSYGSYSAVHSGTQAPGEKYCQNIGGSNDNTCPLGGLYEWANLMNGSSGCNGTSTQQACPTNVQGLCPSGWHVPSYYEWILSERVIGGSDSVSFPYDTTTIGTLGTNEGGMLKQTGTTNWPSPNSGATNSTGFTALAAGFSGGGSFHDADAYAYFWSTTTYSTNEAWTEDLFSGSNAISRYPNTATDGFSARCLKN